MIITRRIELYVHEADKEKKNEIYKYLKNLSDDVFKAANLIISNRWFEEIFSERILWSDEELKSKAEKLEKENEKLKTQKKSAQTEKEKEKHDKGIKQNYKYLNTLSKEAREKAQNYYCTSEQNITYQLLNQKFSHLPSTIKTCINYTVSKYFKDELFEVKSGKRSLRSYKKGFPIPFMKEAMRFKKEDKQIFMHWIDHIVFGFVLGKDKSNNRAIIERIMDGKYKASNSSIQLKNNKWFLLLAVNIPDEKPELKDNLSVGVDLGINIPAYCALSEGQERQPLGSRDDFLKIRTQMQKRKQRLQRNLKLVKGGKGREKKLNNLNRFRDLERNFVKTYNHQISHNIIQFALKNYAGVIKLELLEGYSENDKASFLLRNWSYYELQKMVEYKAQRNGIKVVYIDPYHTSQNCSECGHFEEGQRLDQQTFRCKKCAVEMNADYNGARNIALSNKIVTKKEECEYHKRNNSKE